MALGAKGVLVGRPLTWGSIGGRQEGVKIYLKILRDAYTSYDSYWCKRYK